MAPKAAVDASSGTPPVVGGAPGQVGSGTPSSAVDMGAVSEAGKKKKEGIEIWIKWFESTLKEGKMMDKAIMKEAAVVAVEAGVLSVQDSVGLESADLSDFPGFAALSMSARALMKRGVAIAQEVHGSSSSKQERPIATLLCAQNIRTEQVMTELSGRAATEAAIEKAVLELEDASYTVQSLLEKKGLKGLNFTMVPEREVGASVRAEVASAAA